MAQPDEADPEVKVRMRKKLRKVIKRGYMEMGVMLALTRFFAGPKGDDDIRMVYDALVGGLNDVIWMPSFMLPIMESFLRAVDEGTWMTALDVGEIFLNFPLHEVVQKYCGVDVSHYFPDLKKEEGPVCLRWV